MAITALARKVSKIFFFILLFVAVGRNLPKSEFYLSEDFATEICQYVYGDVNAEAIYDVYFYIDTITIFPVATLFYVITMKLMSLIRR